jgi:hypothetical protein
MLQQSYSGKHAIVTLSTPSRSVAKSKRSVGRLEGPIEVFSAALEPNQWLARGPLGSGPGP